MKTKTFSPRLARLKRKAKADYTRHDWQACASEFIRLRRGIVGAAPNEVLAGYVDGFKPVYILAGKKVSGESWYVWFVFPGQGYAARVVNKLLPGVYVDHEGTVIEHDPRWTLILGTVTRIGSQPLLSLDMFRRRRD